MTPSADHRRVLILAYVLALIGPLATDAFLPALPSINQAFLVPSAITQQSVTLILVAVAVSQLLVGPLSDRWGRLKIVRSAAILYGLTALLAVWAGSFQQIFILRLLQALAIAAATVISRALLRDLFSDTELAQRLAINSAVIATSLTIGPIIGGFGVSLLGWQAPFLFLAGLGALAWLLSIGISETLPRSTNFGWRHPLRGYRIVITHPLFGRCVLVASFCFCGLFAFISLSSFIIIDGFGVAAHYFGVVMGLLSLGHIAGAFTLHALMSKRRSAPLDSQRLFRTKLMAMAALLCVASSLLLAVNLLVPANLILVIGSMVGYIFGAGLIFPVVTAMAIQPFPELAATAMAMFNLIFFAVGGSSTWILGLFFDQHLGPLVVFVFFSAVLTWGVGQNLLRLIKKCYA